MAEYPLPPLPGVGYFTGARQLVARALSLLPPDSGEAGRLLSRHASTLYFEEADYQGAQQAFASSLAIAQRDQDEALERETLAGAGYVDAYQLDLEESRTKAQRVIELARRVGDVSAEVAALYSMAIADVFLGDFDKVAQYAPEGLALAERLRDRNWLCRMLFMSGYERYARGDWAAAREFCERAMAVSPLDARPFMTGLLVEYQTGELNQGQLHLERLLEIMRLTPPETSIFAYGIAAMVVAAGSRIAGITDQIEIAEAAAETVLGSEIVTPMMAMFARSGLGLTAAQRGDILAASQQYDALQSVRDIIFPNIVGHRLLGLLAQTQSNPQAAIGHFEDSLASCRRASHRPELAWTCCDYADTLLERNDPGDREKAMSLLDESLAISNELGMRPLMERVLSRREILKA